MEVERRNVGSGNDLQEKRKKKPWSLPLATFLSFNDRGVHPECPNASNVFHKCGRHCVDKIPSGKFFVDAITSEEDWEKKSEKRGINFVCPNASNPYHKCPEYCFEKLSEKQQNAGINQPAMKPKRENQIGFTTNRLVKPECKNASNPYHVCDEYCLENVPERVQPGQVIRLKNSREVKKELRNEVRTGSLPLCKHASNPYHDCTVLCFQIVPDNNLAKGDNTKGASTSTNKSIARRSLDHVSGRFRKANEYCLEYTPEMDYLKGETKEERNTLKPNMNLECKNVANPDHLYAEYCFQPVSEKEQAVRLKNSKEGEKVLNIIEKTGTGPKCKYASDPQHECTKFCIQNVPDSKITRRENLRGVSITADKASVHQDYKNLFSPHYKITGHSFEDTFRNEQPTEAIMMSKKKERAVLPEVIVNPDCKYASNPYHKCAENCFQNVPEKEQHRQIIKLKDLKALKSSVSNKKITSGQPQCSFASNPYHKCAEYCFTKNISNGNIPDGVMKTNVRKKENKYSVGKYVNLNCKDASNPSHICHEYCLKGIRTEIAPKNELVEGIKEVVEMKNVDEPKDDQPLKVAEASDLFHEWAEYRSQKKIDDDEEENLEVVEMKNLDEPKTDQPLKPAAASDLFHEWAIYCSQKKIDDDDEENLVGMEELSTRKGKGSIFLSEFESPKLEKVQITRGFPRFLPISLLFFLGFIFSMVSWTQVIHSLVMSSEKNQVLERRKPEECGNASEPYNSCSDCYFDEFGEE